MKIKLTSFLISLSFVLAELSYSAVPVMIEHVVPQYFGSKSAASANNSRTPFAVCLEIQGLAPNTTYDVQIGVGLTTDAATVYGAGNVWNRNRNAFTGQRDTAAFTTDASGNSGPFWSFIQPTGNGSRFSAGQQHNLRVGYTLSGGSFSSDPSFVGTKVMTAIDIPLTPRTTETTDDGAFITGKNFSAFSGKFVLLYNDTSSSALPLSSYQIRTSAATNTSQSELPASVNDILIQGGKSSVGDFACVFPIGANNPNGLRKIEIRNSDNSIARVLMDYDGTWQNGTNTSALLRRDVGVIDLSQLFRIDLTALIEGFYSASTNTMVPDAVTVELHQSTSPFGIVDYGASGLSSLGSGQFYLCNAVNGTSYYVVLRHRNSVETWSSAGVQFNAGVANYDFTSSASQAYGSNMVQVDASPLEFAVFSGDVNQDGTVDASDLGVIDNDAFTFASGYIPSDLNGDGFADASDYSLADNNAFNFVGRIAP